MINSELTADNVKNAVETYGNMIYRLCLIMLKNTADAEDVSQETFLTYMQKFPGGPPEREKAWLMTVAVNKCRNLLRYNKRHRTDPEELLSCFVMPEQDKNILLALEMLPDKFRLAMTLHYIEGYKVDEIADMLDLSASAVKMRLSKGRKLLEEKYRKEFM